MTKPQTDTLDINSTVSEEAMQRARNALRTVAYTTERNQRISIEFQEIPDVAVMMGVSLNKQPDTKINKLMENF